MESSYLVYLVFVLTCLVGQCSKVTGEQSALELPVQLVGFPFIILAVRLTNFVKKLTYSLSPSTYRARNRRQLESPEALEFLEAEKKLVEEFGAKACVYERICLHYAERAKDKLPKNDQLDWPTVFSQYKRSPDQNKEFYLLSVFLGDIVGSPQLCHHLAKRRPCTPKVEWS